MCRSAARAPGFCALGRSSGGTAATCDQQHPIGIRIRAALILGRGALNRRIELAGL
ncbi:hypothetical protein [Streptomyces colonosanans]|uniref:hypothetical protein n=1 Tax=Streptomyces colonosanans TaxID=1428652 RepID=UPI0015A6ECF2|nr:hypothetical protein [Streptomyces colonosanans]